MAKRGPKSGQKLAKVAKKGAKVAKSSKKNDQKRVKKVPKVAKMLQKCRKRCQKWPKVARDGRVLVYYSSYGRKGRRQTSHFEVGRHNETSTGGMNEGTGGFVTWNPDNCGTPEGWSAIVGCQRIGRQCRWTEKM